MGHKPHGTISNVCAMWENKKEDFWLLVKHKQITPEIDEQIRRVYLEKTGILPVGTHSPVKDLAERLNIPRWKISRRAISCRDIDDIDLGQDYIK